MPEPDYNPSAVSSAPTSSPSPQSRPSGLGSRSGRNMDADMYAGSSYAPTSNAGTSSATQTFSSSATSTGSFTGAASNKSDDGPGYAQSYNPAATLYSNTATAMAAAGATLKAPTKAVYDPMNLYSSQNMQEVSTEINDYLRGTAVDDALREALNIPEVYQGAQTEEEPEPNIDMDVLQEAMIPEPITVEKLPDVIVKAGDTLTAIAEANGVPVQDVIDANPQIANPDMIRPGEVVKLSSRFDTKGETPSRDLPEVLSIPEAAAYMGKERATLIMKGINKLFGLVPPKTDVEKQAKSELEYFLDAQPESSLPDFFKYIPNKVQLAEYMKGRAERKKTAGVMNFSDRSALTNMDNLQLVDIEPTSPISNLLDFIGEGEGDYNSSNTGTDSKGDIVHYSHDTTRDGKKLSEMTLDEIRTYQAIKDPKDKDRLFTVGKYQLVPETFEQAVKGLGLDDDTVLTPKVQDEMGIYLVSKKPGRSRLSGYLSGDTSISTNRAMLDLAMEFASVPVPEAIKKGTYGSWPKRDILAGESFYADPKSKKGGNKASHTVAQTISMLKSVQGVLTSEQAPATSLRPVERNYAPSTSLRPQARN